MGTLFSSFEAGGEKNCENRMKIKKVVALCNFVVATATASGLPCTWKQPLNYTMRLCSSTVYAHLLLTLHVAFGRGQCLCAY